jgi:hypothetical protein
MWIERHLRGRQCLRRTKYQICALLLIAVAIPLSAKADADVYPWKLLETTPDGKLYIAHEYATKNACRWEGEKAARDETAVNCTSMACAVRVWCVDKRAAMIAVFPGTGAPLKLRCHPAYYGISPGATQPAEHPEWCEYVKQQ